ncbi:hypothetical protein A33Q_3620 [Indibacter alkaliphilus LW1]|uniref:Uncharacterized protein n=1 Tax=Indibacter alkaliphilus (strain CCUG 57479 / KCTC 22604 / LW1) TaxID=1189612 RepID=S2D436_INDAL|nr:tetratricopeptide repeat protein [Indibacter alkaliphilus]EOZ93674.1 hypothetical protein A33Q_3620 [Indibacter alkaliphilus LW1]
MDIKVIEKFEAYLRHEMSEEELRQFEEELASNTKLSQQFQQYQEIEQSMAMLFSQEERQLKESLSNLGKKYMKEGPLEKGGGEEETPIRNIENPNYFRLFSAIAAIFVMILAAYFLLFKSSQSAQEMAERYYSENLTVLSQTMGGNEDKVQLGIVAYNMKDYDLARTYFEEVLQEESQNWEALKFLGLTYLAQRNYERALAYFEELAALENLYSNPGLFYQAFTLMLRSESDDISRAKEILRQIIDENAEGSRQAKEWLDKL